MPNVSDMQLWLTTNKDAIGGVSALVGIIGGPFLSVLKTGIGSLNDRSWERKTAKSSAEIAQSIKDLQEAELGAGTIGSDLLEPYREHIRQRIVRALDQIRKNDERRTANAKRQFEMPEGIRSWLLLFRPNDVVGWLVHSMFYAVVVSLASSLAVFLHRAAHVEALDYRDWSLLGTRLLALTMLAFVSRSAALKRRAIQLNSMSGILGSDGISRWRKVFLLFKAPGSVAIAEIMSVYVFAVEGIFMLTVSLGSVFPNLTAESGVRGTFMRIVFVLAALLCGTITAICWYDVLLRRRLAVEGYMKQQANTIAEGSPSVS